MRLSKLFSPSNLLTVNRFAALPIVLSLLFFINSCENNGDLTLAPSKSSKKIDQLLEDISQNDSQVNEKLKLLSEAHILAQAMNDDKLKVSSLTEVGNTYLRLKQPEKFRDISHQVFNLSKRIKDSVGMANALFNIGYYYRNERMDSAYNYYSKAEQIYASVDDPFEAGKMALSRAILQKNAKDYVGGEESSIKAIQYFTPLKELRYLSSANSNLGLISEERGQHDLAIEYHKTALEYRKKLPGNSVLTVSSLNNIGLVYKGKEEYQEAIQYYELGLAYDSLFYKRPTTYARLLDNLAYAKFKMGEKNEMPGIFLRPRKIRDSLKDNLGVVTSDLHLAEYYFSEDSITQARAYAQNALSRATPLKYHRGMLDALMLLSKTTSKDEALGYTQTYIQINDSLQKEENKFKDQFARLRFETAAIETENNKITKLNNNLILLLLLLVFSGLITYIFIQRRLNNKELNFRESQQEANEEIYNLMLAQQAKLEEGKQFEKQRISEELHDGVLGRLFGTRLSLDSLNSNNNQDVIETRAKYIDDLKLIEQEIRKISHDLSSDMFGTDLLYMDVVEQLIENYCDVSNLDYKFEYDDSINWEEVPNNIKVHLYRIIQESLQNVHKHAAAKKVVVYFGKIHEDIELSIKDDGIGYQPKSLKKGIGLKNIKSRVKQINGRLNLDSSKGKGTLISVRVNF